MRPSGSPTRRRSPEEQIKSSSPHAHSVDRASARCGHPAFQGPRPERALVPEPDHGHGREEQNQHPHPGGHLEKYRDQLKDLGLAARPPVRTRPNLQLLFAHRGATFENHRIPSSPYLRDYGRLVTAVTTQKEKEPAPLPRYPDGLPGEGRASRRGNGAHATIRYPRRADEPAPGPSHSA